MTEEEEKLGDVGKVQENNLAWIEEVCIGYGSMGYILGLIKGKGIPLRTKKGKVVLKVFQKIEKEARKHAIFDKSNECVENKFQL